MDKVRRRSPIGLIERATADAGNDDNDPTTKEDIGSWHMPRKRMTLCLKRAIVQPSKWVPQTLILMSVFFFLYAVVSQMMLGSASQPLWTQHHSPSTTTHLVMRKHVGAQYLPQRPRSIGFYFDGVQSDNYLGTETIDPNMFRLRKPPTLMDVSKDFLERQQELKNSREYRHNTVDEFETEECVAQYEWQKSMFPTCNLLFEQDLTHLQSYNDIEVVRLIAHGYWRDVWKVDNGNNTVALKSIRYEHDYVARNYDRHRRDAVAMEQLTSSPWVMDIFGHCGNSGLFEYAAGGSLDDSLFEYENENDKWKPSERLIVAYQVASGIAATHNHPKEGVPAIAHTDITTSQFVYTESGLYKLNDFNRCRFIRWNKVKNQTCEYTVGNNPGPFRSPEEYAQKGQSEKVDIYSMGNIFYVLLTGKWPFEHLSSTKKARTIVKQGGRPPIDGAILNSTDPFDRALLEAMQMCWVQEPTKRATAREVQSFIETKLLELGVQKG